MTRVLPELHPQPMTPHCAARAFLACALAATLHHDRQLGLVTASLMARADTPRVDDHGKAR